MYTRNGLVGPKAKRIAKADLTADHSEDQTKAQAPGAQRQSSVTQLLKTCASDPIELTCRASLRTTT